MLNPFKRAEEPKTELPEYPMATAAGIVHTFFEENWKETFEEAGVPSMTYFAIGATLVPQVLDMIMTGIIEVKDLDDAIQIGCPFDLNEHMNEVTIRLMNSTHKGVN